MIFLVWYTPCPKTVLYVPLFGCLKAEFFDRPPTYRFIDTILHMLLLNQRTHSTKQLQMFCCSSS